MQAQDSNEVHNDGESAPGETNLRLQYLQSIGLKRDPFNLPVSEQEYAFSGRSELPPDETAQVGDSFSTLRYFVDPAYPEGSDRSLVQELRRPGPAFVFGAPGMGKTSLSLVLAARCRREPDRTLVVMYNQLGKDVDHSRTADDHYRRLTQALTTDLFIQIVEQYYPEDGEPTAEQLRLLIQITPFGCRRLNRLVGRILADPNPDSLWGLATYWPMVDRLPVRRITQSPELLRWLEQVQAAVAARPPEMSGEESWTLGLETARAWGFERVLVLVDNVDTWQRSQLDMLRLIDPLIEATGPLQEQQVSFKFFLPDELRDVVVEQYRAVEPDRPEPLIVQLTWPKQKLRELLWMRFRAAGSHRLGFGDLTEPDFGDELDETLLEEAHGSPRRLLTLISKLIDVHIGQTPFKRRFTRDEWQQALEQTRLIYSSSFSSFPFYSEPDSSSQR